MAGFAHVNILEPDAVLASQLLTDRAELPEPERSLMVAVFEDGVRCFLNYCRATDRTERALYQSARRWIGSFERSGLYAFENVCELLGLAPDYIRRELVSRRDERRDHDDSRPPAPRFSRRTHRARCSIPGAGAGEHATGPGATTAERAAS